MTTLAYRDGILAADTRAMVNGWKNPFPVTKIFRLDNQFGVIGGFAGELAGVGKLVDWLRCGASGERPPIGDDSRVVVLLEREKLQVFEGGGSFIMHAEYAAFGSGMPPATAALIMGASAVRAVQVAAMVDECTGPDVETLSMEGGEP